MLIKSPHRISPVALAVLLAAAPAANVWGLDYGLSVGYSLEYSDNIEKTETNKEDAYTHVLSVGYAMSESWANFDAHMNSSVLFRHFSTDNVDDDSLVSLDTAATWKIRPETLSWMASDRVSQKLVNPLAPDSPSNTQRTNAFATGPDIIFRISPVHQLKLGSRYSNVWFEESDLDQERYSGNMSWLYESGPNSVLSLNLEADKVKFENEASQGIVNKSAFLRLQYSPARNTVIIDAGRSLVEREGFDDVEGTKGRFSWAREINSSSSFEVSVSQDFTDAGRILLSETELGTGTGGTGDILVNDVFRARRGNLAYNSRGSLVTFSLRGYVAEDEFETSISEDKLRTGGSVRLGYLFSSAVTGAIFGNYERMDFDNVDRIDTNKSGGLNVTWRVGKSLSLAVQGSQVTRTSVGSPVDRGEEYEERRATLSLKYARSARQTYGVGPER